MHSIKTGPFAVLYFFVIVLTFGRIISFRAELALAEMFITPAEGSLPFSARAGLGVAIGMAGV